MYLQDELIFFFFFFFFFFFLMLFWNISRLPIGDVFENGYNIDNLIVFRIVAPKISDHTLYSFVLVFGLLQI